MDSPAAGVGEFVVEGPFDKVFGGEDPPAAASHNHQPDAAVLIAFILQPDDLGIPEVEVIAIPVVLITGLPSYLIQVVP